MPLYCHIFLIGIYRLDLICINSETKHVMVTFFRHRQFFIHTTFYSMSTYIYAHSQFIWHVLWVFTYEMFSDLLLAAEISTSGRVLLMSGVPLDQVSHFIFTSLAFFLPGGIWSLQSPYRCYLNHFRFGGVRIKYPTRGYEGRMRIFRSIPTSCYSVFTFMHSLDDWLLYWAFLILDMTNENKWSWPMKWIGNIIIFGFWSVLEDIRIILSHSLVCQFKKQHHLHHQGQGIYWQLYWSRHL